MERRVLHVPPLVELADVVRLGLSKNYKEVTVEVVECPDLSKPPFSLAGSGLGGNSALVDVGGQLNLHYQANHNKHHFDVSQLQYRIQQYNINSNNGANLSFWIGAGASKPDRSTARNNSELIPNINLQKHLYLSKEAYIDHTVGHGKLVDYPHVEFSSLGNFYASEGKPSPVLKIVAKKRTGPLNIVTCMREAILKHYGEKKQIGLGGVLMVKNGSIKSHIMPGFPQCDLVGKNIEWLRYFEVKAPLTCLSTFVSSDTHNDALRIEHTHFFSTDPTQANDGGHYHYDTTPDDIHYEGYYHPASFLYRIDRALPPPSKL